MPELAATLTTDEHGERVGHEELPPFIQTQADLDRWRLCLGVVERMTGQHESTQDVWHASRTLFFSDIPTTPEDSAFRLQGDDQKAKED